MDYKEFAEKYISEAENMTNPNSKKMIIPNGAYAIGEMIAHLIVKLEQTRLTK